jgi:hypothetical protein
LNGAINIMRKYMGRENKPMKKIKGKCLSNPIVIRNVAYE